LAHRSHGGEVPAMRRPSGKFFGDHAAAICPLIRGRKLDKNVRAALKPENTDLAKKNYFLLRNYVDVFSIHSHMLITVCIECKISIAKI